MKNKRAYVVLEMFFLTQEKGYFSEAMIVKNLGVSRSTFFKSLSEFRCYLQECRPYYELVYDKEKNVYRLQHVSI